MATSTDTTAWILSKLRHPERFSARRMFGEFALYADGKVVALICDDRLFVKIVPASVPLETLCEKAQPYPGAKPYYLIDEGQLTTRPDLPAILFAIAESAPVKKRKAKRSSSAQKRVKRGKTVR